MKTLSSNRLAISYASVSWRILIDTKIVDALKVFRLKELRIEINFNVEKGDEVELKGIIVQILGEFSQTHVIVTTKIYTHVVHGLNYRNNRISIPKCDRSEVTSRRVQLAIRRAGAHGNDVPPPSPSLSLFPLSHLRG